MRGVSVSHLSVYKYLQVFGLVSSRLESSWVEFVCTVIVVCVKWNDFPFGHRVSDRFHSIDTVAVLGSVATTNTNTTATATLTLTFRVRFPPVARLRVKSCSQRWMLYGQIYKYTSGYIFFIYIYIFVHIFAFGIVIQVWMPDHRKQTCLGLLLCIALIWSCESESFFYLFTLMR